MAIRTVSQVKKEIDPCGIGSDPVIKVSDRFFSQDDGQLNSGSLLSKNNCSTRKLHDFFFLLCQLFTCTYPTLSKNRNKKVVSPRILEFTTFFSVPCENRTHNWGLGVLKHIFFPLLFCDIEYHTVIENTRFFNDAAITKYQLFLSYITQYHTVLLAVLLARENMLCFISYQL